MDALEPGMKVECVDVSGMEPSDRGSLQPGAVYTINDCYDHNTGDPMVRLVEVRPWYGFYARRFRPIKRRSTDISIFVDIVEKVKRGEPVEILETEDA